jgi:Skp family chaperone for outer membrane proteins
MRKYNELQNAYSTLNEIGMTKNAADRGTAVAKLNRLWATTDLENTRLYNEGQDEAKKRYYKSIADSMQPQAKEWYEYAIPAATTVASAYISKAPSINPTSSATSTETANDGGDEMTKYYENLRKRNNTLFPWRSQS